MSGDISSRLRRIVTLTATAALASVSLVVAASATPGAGAATPRAHSAKPSQSSPDHVTYSRQATPNTTTPSSTGYIEVCKFAADSFVKGAFTVSINDGHSTITATIPVGQCTAPLEVAAGSVTVTESPSAPYYLKTVQTYPSNALVSFSGNTAVVTVTASPDSSTETAVFLYNATHTGLFKVCKTLTGNSGDLITNGQNVFKFDPSYQLAGSSSFVSLPTVSVQVLSTGTAYCVLDPYALPLGTLVKITEEGMDNVTLRGVTVQPASQDAGSTSTTAMLRIGPNPNGIVTATFTNEAMGTIEICKILDDHLWMGGPGGGSWDSPYNGTPFQFSVNGGAPFTVLAGECSGPITVPAGTATVQELATPNFTFVRFLAVGPDGTSRIAGGSHKTDNPVKVKVPYGGVGNETLVTAVNRVNTGQIKVCKINNGPSVGVYSFKFQTQYSNQGNTYTKNDVLHPTQAGVPVCSGLTKQIPVIQPNGQPTTFTTTEGPSPYIHDQNGNPTVEPTSIVYGGNGQVIEIRAWQQGDTIAQDGTYHGTATVGQGINVFTFTNSLVLDP
jgi:hypothetical protein